MPSRMQPLDFVMLLFLRLFDINNVTIWLFQEAAG